jgi:hypothetical protein
LSQDLSRVSRCGAHIMPQFGGWAMPISVHP